jgi:hypothetical protein
MEEIQNIKHNVATPTINTIKSIFYSKLVKYGLLLITFILGVLYLNKRYKTNCEALENKFYQDTKEIISGINYLLYHPSKIRYIFWTGGYSSTFILIQALIIEGYPVQPIYIKCQTLDDKFSIQGKQSQQKEIETMSRLRSTILTDYPHLKPMFLPTMYVYSIKKDYDISNKFRQVYKQFSFFSPDVNQFERLARFSIHYDKNIEIGLIKTGTSLDYASSGIRINEGTKNCQLNNKQELLKLNNEPNNINPIKDYGNLDIFRSFRFPIIHMTKEDIKRLSARQKVVYLLQMTWTCWYPNNIGKPCNKCHQCSKKMDLDGFINN